MLNSGSTHNPTALFQARARSAWTSDDRGRREWNLGWSVYRNEIHDDDQKAFVVYEDDGRGNGDYVGDFDTLELAARIVNQLAAQADERGF
jgi:hypothetical protein